MLLIRSSFSLGLIFLAGCTPVGPTAVELEAAVDGRLEQGLSFVAEPSKERASSVSLDGGLANALKTAVLADEAYVAAWALEAEALSNVKVSRSVRRPQYSANANIGVLREGTPVSETTTGASGGISISQLIYDGGVAEGAISRSQAMALAAKAGRIERGNDLALEAAGAWIDYWVSSERSRLLSHKLGDFDALMNQMDRMSENGLLDKASFDSSRQQILDIHLERTRIASDKASAEVRFIRHFQKAPTKKVVLSQLISREQAKKLSTEWKNAPALKKTVAELYAAKGAETEARAAFRPTISLTAGVNSPMQRDDSTDVTAGFQISYAFGDGGRRKARLEAAGRRVEALENQITASQRVAKSEMQSALIQLEALQRSSNLLSEKARLSASEAKTARSQIATGQASLQQLVAAEIENYRAQDQSLQFKRETQMLLLSIAARSGHLGTVIGLDS